jgi:hypothetical protein
MGQLLINKNLKNNNFKMKILILWVVDKARYYVLFSIPLKMDMFMNFETEA